MTRVRIDLFSSLDGYTSAGGGPDNPMGEDWQPLTAAYLATRTMRQRVLGDTSGAGTSGVDDAYAGAFFERIGAEIMGAAMFGLHAFPDDPDWKGWWGEEPPFGFPVYGGRSRHRALSSPGTSSAHHAGFSAGTRLFAARYQMP